MRFISVFSGLLASLVLAGCVSAPARQLVLESSQVVHHGENAGSCNDENVVRNMQSEESAESHGLDPANISVLNWNIYKGQREDWAADFRRYIRDHDVVTMQEAHLDDDLRSMLGREHSDWVLNTAFHYQGKATGVMTASRVQPVYSCGQHTAEPLIRLPKTSLVSYYPVAGMQEDLLVANIHGINFTLGLDVYKEQREKLYSAIKSHAGPVVLAGDFNTWRKRRLEILLSLTERLDLSELSFDVDYRIAPFGTIVDRVFVRGLKAVETSTEVVDSSDHNPRAITLSM